MKDFFKKCEFCENYFKIIFFYKFNYKLGHYVVGKYFLNYWYNNFNDVSRTMKILSIIKYNKSAKCHSKDSQLNFYSSFLDHC